MSWHKISVVSLIGLIISAFSHSGYGEDPYEIFIVQDKSRIEISGRAQVIQLEPKGFRFETKLLNIEGIYLSASFDDLYYKLEGQQELKDWPWIKEKTMAEAHFNKEKELLVDDENFLYWFYDPSLDWHRFDKKVRIEDDLIHATKRVNSIWDVDAKSSMAFEACNDTIYLFFFHLVCDDDGNPVEAAFRKKATLLFRDPGR